MKGLGGRHKEPPAPIRRRLQAPGMRLRVAQAAASVCLLTAVVSGPVAMHLARVAMARTAATDVPAPTHEVEAFAVLYLSTFLEEAAEGHEDVLRPYLSEPVSLKGVHPGRTVVTRAVPVSVRAERDRVWSVIVAAELLHKDGTSYARAGVRYFKVVLAGLEAGVTALGLPSEMAAPGGALSTRISPLPQLAQPSESPPVVAAARFVEAYLTGQGEVDRYVAPGVSVVPPRPAPYRTVQLVRAGLSAAGNSVLVRLEVVARDAAGATRGLHYTLRLARRAGRWEVTDPNAIPQASSPALTLDGR